MQGPGWFFIYLLLFAWERTGVINTTIFTRLRGVNEVILWCCCVYDLSSGVYPMHNNWLLHAVVVLECDLCWQLHPFCSISLSHLEASCWLACSCKSTAVWMISS